MCEETGAPPLTLCFVLQAPELQADVVTLENYA